MSTHAEASPEFQARLVELDRAGLLDAAPDAALDRLARLARRALRADAATITVCGSHGMRNVGRDGIGEPFASSRQIAGEEVLLSRVVHQGRAVAAADLEAIPEFEKPFGMASGAAAPVRAPSGLVIGALSVASRARREWTPRELELLGEVAETITAEMDLRLTAHSVARRERRAAAQQSALELIASDAPLRDSLTALAAAIEDAADGDLVCSILLLDRDLGVLRDVAGPHLPDEYRAAIDGALIGPDVGSCGTAAHTGETVVAADIRTDPRWSEFAALALPHGLAACWSTPILAEDGAVLGTFAVYYDEPREPDDQHEALVADAIHVARIAIERDDARERLLAANRRTAGLAAEHAALRRVATAVAGDATPEHVFRLAAEEAAALLDADVAWVDGDADRRAHGRSSRIAALVGGAGEHRVLVAERHGHPFTDEDHQRLRSFAELVGLALANAEHRGRLAERSSLDPLTDLYNHRELHDRLREAVAGAERDGTRLAIVTFDLDDFRDVNDVHGHRVGDAVLIETARRLSTVVRTGETLARFGGDEFALLLPGSSAVGARATAERARAALRAEPGPEGTPLGVSVGVAVFEPGVDEVELMARADDALQRARRDGGDRVAIWDPDDDGLSPDQRTRQAARLRALAGVRALARAVDAKDASTHRHSERVARLASALARERGWPASRIELLRSAALIHDVGKIGVPDRVLLKRRPLTKADWAALHEHPALGAQIAAEILTAEQVTWIQEHHERMDGDGYPDGIPGAHISDGGRLLALADAWDAMTSVRAYHEPLTPAEAIAECRRCAGTQFAPEAVEALARLYEHGALDVVEG